jgi:2-polyprenyl-3-methyl-5-hydroxy-6-metoxy-1,4-benzoquinol methylase
MTTLPELTRPTLGGRLRARLYAVLVRESEAGSGTHIDPEDPAVAPPSTAGWSKERFEAQASATMEVFADTMRAPDGGSVRDGVIADLADFYQVAPDEVVRRCLHWEEWSVEEWRDARADEPQGLARFYNSTESWSYDLLWYSYLQTLGYAVPNHVIAADWLPAAPAGARLLDFGSGVGVTAQLFAALGYEVTLADLSETLLGFAHWRLDRRNVPATYLHLPADLPHGAYDVVIALDTLAHVPDAAQTARQLYAATRPGGYLITNFDVRRKSERNAWHLYADDLPLRWAIERAGFVPVRKTPDNLAIYQARPVTGAARRAGAWLRLASPPVRAARAVRHAVARAILVAVKKLTGRMM